MQPADLPAVAQSQGPQPLSLPVVGDVIPFPTGRFAIPTEQMGEFNALSKKEKERILNLLSFFERMEAGGIVQVSESLGFQLRAAGGFGASNLRANYYKWLQNGWRGLIRRYTNGGEKLPLEFILYFRALCERNGRSMRQAMNELARNWTAGKPIPGYGTWQEWFMSRWPERDLPLVCPGTPKGWRKSNLYTLQPTKDQRALKTRGFAAAKKYLPSIVRDTSTLLPLQLITIDDFELDQLCFWWDPVRGIRSICRMSGILAMDVATRKILGLILKPRLEMEDGRKQTITRAEVRLLLYQVLRDYGVPQGGMTILAENAAAAVTTEVELTFKNLFGGRVAVTRTNMIDGKVLANGFCEKGGKPWLKGWIESGFNVAANIAASLPGQKGSSYMVKPGELEEKKRVAERLIGLGDKDARLSDEQLAKARVPFASAEELCDAYLQVFSIMENRTEHKMIGFDQVLEWRLDEGDTWKPREALASLTAEQQLDVEVRARMQSPRERWAALLPKAGLVKVPDHVLMMLLLTPKKAEVKGHKITFVHGGTGYTWGVDPRSEIAQLRAGSEVLCYFDPSQPQHAHVARLDGRPLGEVKRFGPVDITDMTAVSESERQLGELYNSVLASVRERPLHLEEDRQLAEDAQVNQQLVQEAEALRNRAGITATLARKVDMGLPVVTQAGAALAASMASGAQKNRASKAAASALQDSETLNAIDRL